MSSIFITYGVCLLSAISISDVKPKSEISQTINCTNFTDSTDLVANGATLRNIGSQFKFTEGPAADKKGNIYFTDQPNNTIWKFDTQGKLSLFMDNAGRANGLYFDRSGNIIACADEENEIWEITTDKKTKVLLTDFEGKKLNGPNDLWIDDSGGIYFTDPFYQRDYWHHTKQEQPGQYLYYFDRITKAVTIVDTAFNKPNGIIGTPDGKYLYVADIGDSKTYRYVISGKGMLSNRELFVSMGSDGMTLDNKGNLYLTGKGVTVFDPAGKKVMNIPVPESWTGNVCFGGSKKNLLFITASKSVFTLKMKVRGN